MSSFHSKIPAPSRPRVRRSLAQIPQAGGGAVDKENLTTDVDAIRERKREKQKNPMNEKKLRSKSLGPGGLDALKSAAGNRRQSTVPFPLKSILKPTVPLSPPRNIPSFAESRKKTPARRSPRKSTAGRSRSGPTKSDLLIDFSTPTSAAVVGSNLLANPFDTFDPLSDQRNGRSTTPTEEELRQREAEEREQRQREKKAILEQREARRKSMANRRVSFAPEATLHTWNVVELAEEYTSSTSNNSTRRVSSATNSTPHSASEGNAVGRDEESEERQPQHDTAVRDTHNDQRFSSSPFSGSSAAGSDDGAPADLVPANDDTQFSDSEDGENTAMSMDNMTARSISSHSGGSTSSSLDRSLRQAAEVAGTRGIDYDENGDLDVEYANVEIAGAFKPWIKKGSERPSFGADDLSSRLDQENVNPFVSGSPQSKPHQTYCAPSEKREGSPSVPGAGRRRSVGNASVFGGETMEFTNVVGGIVREFSPSKDFSGESETASDEDMTMEFTSVFGGVLAKDKSPADEYVDHQDYEAGPLYPALGEDAETDMEMEMEMTGAVGGILPPIEEHTEPLEDETIGMDMTNALGKILTPIRDRPCKHGPIFDEPETNEPESSPFQENVAPSPAKPETIHHMAPVASENGSPSLARVVLNPRQSAGSRKSSTPTKPSRRTSNTPRTPITPPGRQSPRKSAPRNAGTISPSRRSMLGTPSPKKLAQPTGSQSRKAQSPGPLFHRNDRTGQSTPSFVLKPPTRTPPGLGIYKEGLGSPRVAEILDRRRSIGDDAGDFVPENGLGGGVRFESPKQLEREIEELQNHTQTFGEADEKNSALNLREMISSLTPKKNKFKGRKSLHVGSAKGLLGKRPAELDDDDDYDDDHSLKRLKGREASPVKNVRLPAPPSKDETVGRTSRLSILNGTGMSPPKYVNNTTTSGPSKGKNLFDGQLVNPLDREATTPDGKAVEHNAEPHIKPIQLSEFLQMTNIHFMELTTTKRRHTMAPDTEKKRLIGSSASGPSKDIGLADCVTAGFCTIPMLELYQHSCRELKSYISEGRRIIRSIETETYEDNPPLFQEYISAPPDIRLLMDNQFRNVKTHARLLSKSMWYEWRMKLLEGLKQGLDRHVEEMKVDDKLLLKKEKLLSDVVPKLVERQGKLLETAQNLKRVVEDMESCDQEELRGARIKLRAVDREIFEKKKQLEEMRNSLRGMDSVVETGAETKRLLTQQINESERVREECRGWSTGEVLKIQSSVHSIEKRTGWTVLSVTPAADSQGEPVMAMGYRKELRLDFNPNFFSARPAKNSKPPSKPNGGIPLTLTYDTGSFRPRTETNKVTPSAEKVLMLHALRTNISRIQQGSVPHPKPLLTGISKTWDTAWSLQNEIRLLQYCGVTRCQTAGSKKGEASLLNIRCILLGQRRPTEAGADGSMDEDKPVPSRIDVTFTVKPQTLANTSITTPNVEVDIGIDINVCKVYGFGDGAGNSTQVSDAKILDFLKKTVQPGADTNFGNGVWRDAVKALEEKLFVP